ncbi:phosphonate C-P lyase system protein PhnG [Magnetospira thiophila]
MLQTTAQGDGKTPRQRWMGVLARASGAQLEGYWKTHGDGVSYSFLRRPENGLVMVRCRPGGQGQPFNLGEMSVTRCTVRLDNGTVGHAYVAGRDARQAELAAAFDALLQDPQRQDQLTRDMIAALESQYLDARDTRSKKAAATKVDFFTLVRGEDE